MIVPLFRYKEEVIRARISAIAPDWGGVGISGSAKYLGFYVGPDKGSVSWNEPLLKYGAKAKIWGGMGLGMFLTMQAYQVYICSVLQFIAQLEPLPEEFQCKDRGAIQSLFPGPTAWMVPQCLKDGIFSHLPTQLVDMQAVAQAAKVRVCRFENLQHGGLHVEARARRLLSNFDNACSLGHVAWCKGGANITSCSTYPRPVIHSRSNSGKGWAEQ